MLLLDHCTPLHVLRTNITNEFGCRCLHNHMNRFWQQNNWPCSLLSLSFIRVNFNNRINSTLSSYETHYYCNNSCGFVKAQLHCTLKELSSVPNISKLHDILIIIWQMCYLYIIINLYYIIYFNLLLYTLLYTFII